MEGSADPLFGDRATQLRRRHSCSVRFDVPGNERSAAEFNVCIKGAAWGGGGRLQRPAWLAPWRRTGQSPLQWVGRNPHLRSLRTHSAWTGSHRCPRDNGGLRYCGGRRRAECHDRVHVVVERGTIFYAFRWCDERAVPFVAENDAACHGPVPSNK